jgi:transcriptional regulator with XRE-family HTH domain
VKNRNEAELEKFALHFKQVRIANGFTQEKLAYSSGITLSQIARIETARVNPTILTLKILADTMGVTVALLAGYDGS